MSTRGPAAPADGDRSGLRAVTVWLEPGLYDDLDRVAARMGLGLPALFRRATVGYAFVWRHLRKWWGLDLFVLLLVLGLFAPGGRC